MAVIRRAYTFQDAHTFLLLYKSLVRPHLEYANQVWHPHLRKHINSVENVQRRATRLIPGYSKLSYEERLCKLNLPSLAYRQTWGDMIEAYKIATNKYDPDVSQNLLRFNPRISRSHQFKLQKTYSRTNLRKHSFFNRIVETWNSLPESVITARTLHSFEHRLDHHWRNHPLRFTHQRNDH